MWDRPWIHLPHYQFVTKSTGHLWKPEFTGLT